jgi:hypothetical protein
MRQTRFAFTLRPHERSVPVLRQSGAGYCGSLQVDPYGVAEDLKLPIYSWAE